MNPDIPENAISIYGQNDAADDFPVLKAFQQYIDSEQAKARKRMLLLCAFFSALMFIVISVFVVLLISASSRNQMLNDRLVEFAMNDRYQKADQPSAAVQPSSQDAAAILALTTKLEDLQKKLVESQPCFKPTGFNICHHSVNQILIIAHHLIIFKIRKISIAIFTRRQS